MPAAPPAADPPADPHGVSLAQYAGITTALAEGHPLDAVLGNERIAPEAWRPAEIAWKVRVAEGGTEGPLFAELCEKRAVAEDTLARAVAPIDSDLGAWMSFLRAYGAHAAPFDMLKGAGLGLNDLSRLQRRWARRMKEDAELEKQAAELAKKGLGPLPPLRVAPAVLEPFPWSKGPAPKPVPETPKVAVPAETSLAPGKVRLYAYVAIKAQLLESPGNEKQVLEKLGQTDFEATDAGWQEILRSNPDLERDYRRLLDAQRAKIRAAAKQPPTAPATRAAPAVTAPAAPPPPPAPAAPPAAAPPVVRAPSKLAGTALAVDIPRGPALPFSESQVMRAPELPASQAPEPPPPPAEAPKPKGSLAGTSLALDIPRGPALPFSESQVMRAPELPASQAPAPPPPPTEAPKPKGGLAGTSLALDIPRGPALPFSESQVMRAPELPPAAEAAPPPLTLEQHASLSCELAEAKDRVEETLARYHVSPAEKRAADEHYAERFTRDPGAREAWDRAYQAYRTWWLGSRVSR